MEVNAREILAKRPFKADEKVGGFAYAPMTTAQMLDAAEPEWLIEGVLVAGQPAVRGGPLKTYETSVALDLAVSLAEGTLFRDKFRVPKRRRVAVISVDRFECNTVERRSMWSWYFTPKGLYLKPRVVSVASAPWVRGQRRTTAYPRTVPPGMSR